MRYLDPKNDLVFKRIFGDHPNLLKSFLNALLPFHNGEYIEELEYLAAEQVPAIPELKNSIVDVKCKDNNGRQFIVEMQMLWTDGFKSRVLFNASKAYVRQIGRGRRYEILQPVYALSLVDDIFSKDEDKFYHHYAIVDTDDGKSRLDGLEFVFVELPKFKPQNIVDKKMMVLWLRFLTEIQDQQEQVSSDFTENEELNQALEILQESSFTLAELELYDQVWDTVSKERTLLSERTKLAEEKASKKAREKALKEGRAEGMEKGIEQGMQKGMEKGMEQGRRAEKVAMAKKAKAAGVPMQMIRKLTGLSEEDIEKV